MTDETERALAWQEQQRTRDDWRKSQARAMRGTGDPATLGARIVEPDVSAGFVDPADDWPEPK